MKPRLASLKSYYLYHKLSIFVKLVELNSISWLSPFNSKNCFLFLIGTDVRISMSLQAVALPGTADYRQLAAEGGRPQSDPVTDIPVPLLPVHRSAERVGGFTPKNRSAAPVPSVDNNLSPHWSPIETNIYSSFFPKYQKPMIFVPIMLKYKKILCFWCWTVLWIREYIVRIRIRGSVIQNYESGSWRPIDYGPIRILPKHFSGHWKICCQIGIKPSNIITIELLFWNSFESLINSKGPDL